MEEGLEFVDGYGVAVNEILFDYSNIWDVGGVQSERFLFIATGVGFEDCD